MDRETIYAIAFGTIALTLIGGIYFAPSTAPAAATVAERAYATEDVRYKLQQDALKEARKNKGKRRRAAPPPEEEASEEMSEHEEAPIDESAEAPPIE
jgi:hypothetical protein